LVALVPVGPLVAPVPPGPLVALVPVGPLVALVPVGPLVALVPAGTWGVTADGSVARLDDSSELTVSLTQLPVAETSRPTPSTVLQPASPLASPSARAAAKAVVDL